MQKALDQEKQIKATQLRLAADLAKVTRMQEALTKEQEALAHKREEHAQVTALEKGAHDYLEVCHHFVK